MDHKEQHHEHHRHEREKRKKKQKLHDQKWGGLPVHPFWLMVIGVVLTLGAVAVWLFAF